MVGALGQGRAGERTPPYTLPHYGECNEELSLIKLPFPKVWRRKGAGKLVGQIRFAKEKCTATILTLLSDPAIEEMAANENCTKAKSIPSIDSLAAAVLLPSSCPSSHAGGHCKDAVVEKSIPNETLPKCFEREEGE